MNEFPEDAVLIARGKYSTINGERKQAIKELQAHMQAIMGYAGQIIRYAELRNDDDIEYAEEQMAAAIQRLQLARTALQTCNALKHHLDELRPLAWDKTKEIA